MAIEIQNNPSPSLLMVEGDPEALPDANPTLGQRRLAVGTDHLLYLVDETGTKTLVGAGVAVAASAVTFTPTGTIAATDVQAAIAELGTEDAAAHIADTSAAHDASSIGFTPNGSIAATDVQAAIQEVRDEASAGSGALVLLQQLAASSSATLNFASCISSTYDEYQIEIVGLVPATNSVGLWMRMGTGGGPTYDSGANYGWAAHVSRAASAAQGGAETGATKIQVGFSADMVNTSTKGLHGSLRLYTPQSTALHKTVIGQVKNSDASGFHVLSSCQGTYLSTTALTAFQFLMSSGNIASGTIRVYGIAK